MVSGAGRVRILHVYAGNLYGGIEKLLVTLAAERHRCPEMEPVFALCFEGRLADELRATGAAVHMLGNVRLSRPWTTLRARKRLKSLVRALSPVDLVVMHGSWIHVVCGPTIRRLGLPLWFWAHDSYQTLSRIDRVATRLKPDRVLANSKFTLATLPLLFPGVPGQVLHYPVALPPPIDRNAVRQEVRAALGCPSQTTVIFMGARLERWKGHALLLEALSLLKAGDWQAWIAGGPQRPHEKIYYAELQAMAQRLGLTDRVRWLGQRTDIPRLLAAADVHCQPNTGPEPFGIVFIEALQAGLPVVTTRLGAAPEIVDDTCGILTPPGDAHSLADALALLMNVEATEQLTGGPVRAKGLCDPTQQIQELHAVIRISVAT